MTPRVSKRTGFNLAQEILGENFISPEDIRAYPWLGVGKKGFGYSKKQIAELIQNLPSKDVLNQLKRHHYLLVPGPAFHVSLADLFWEWSISILPSSFPSLTYNISENGELTEQPWWIGDEKEKFLCEEKVDCSWYYIHKNTHMSSQESHLWVPTLPTIIQMIWGMVIYSALRKNVVWGYTQTSSMTLKGEVLAVYRDDSGVIQINRSKAGESFQ